MLQQLKSFYAALPGSDLLRHAWGDGAHFPSPSIPCLAWGTNYAETHCSAAACVVNSGPHTEVRPSVRACVGLITGHRVAVRLRTVASATSFLALEPSMMRHVR